MSRLYANENFRLSVVLALIELGHDVLTSYDADNANLGVSDAQVLDFGRNNNRIILTFNRRDFIQLHYQKPFHPGIIVCTEDKDNLALARRIHQAILDLNNNTENQLIRINRLG